MSTARIPFTSDDEAAIRTLTGSMLFLLVVNFLFGGLGLLGGCISFAGLPARFAMDAMAGVGGVITSFALVVYCAGMIAQAAMLFQARSALDKVVQTDTEDQALMSDAFRKLRLFFGLEAALFLVGMGLQCGGFLTQIFGPVGQLQHMGGGL